MTNSLIPRGSKSKLRIFKLVHILKLKAEAPSKDASTSPKKILAKGKKIRKKPIVHPRFIVKSPKDVEGRRRLVKGDTYERKKIVEKNRIADVNNGERWLPVLKQVFY